MYYGIPNTSIHSVCRQDDIYLNCISTFATKISNGDDLPREVVADILRILERCLEPENPE